jgi:hypothetical protein
MKNPKTCRMTCDKCGFSENYIPSYSGNPCPKCNKGRLVVNEKPVWKCTECGNAFDYLPDKGCPMCSAGGFEGHLPDHCKAGAEAQKEQKEQGNKFDEDRYTKVDLSLIPWKILSRYYPVKGIIFNIARDVHHILNNDEKDKIKVVFDNAVHSMDIKLLAVVLGYGEEKYNRDDWKKGFGGDWKRFLKATLRHCHAIQKGEDYDGEVIEGYPKGNDHYGAVMFSLMVATYEVENDLQI